MDINNVLNKDFLNLTTADIIECVNYLKNRLLIEFRKQDKSGIYGFTQKYLAYNSNKIKGAL